MQAPISMSSEGALAALQGNSNVYNGNTYVNGLSQRNPATYEISRGEVMAVDRGRDPPFGFSALEIAPDPLNNNNYALFATMDRPNTLLSYPHELSTGINHQFAIVLPLDFYVNDPDTELVLVPRVEPEFEKRPLLKSIFIARRGPKGLDNPIDDDERLRHFHLQISFESKLPAAVGRVAIADLYMVSSFKEGSRMEFLYVTGPGTVPPSKGYYAKQAFQQNYCPNPGVSYGSPCKTYDISRPGGGYMEAIRDHEKNRTQSNYYSTDVGGSLSHPLFTRTTGSANEWLLERFYEREEMVTKSHAAQKPSPSNNFGFMYCSYQPNNLESFYTKELTDIGCVQWLTFAVSGSTLTTDFNYKLINCLFRPANNDPSIGLMIKMDSGDKNHLIDSAHGIFFMFRNMAIQKDHTMIIDTIKQGATPAVATISESRPIINEREEEEEEKEPEIKRVKSDDKVVIEKV